MTRKFILEERVALLAKGFEDEIYTDLCGPLSVTSLGAPLPLRYLTFPDGTTTRSPTFMVLRTKDEALNAYKTFAAWAQTQHGIKFKALRSDRVHRSRVHQVPLAGMHQAPPRAVIRRLSTCAQRIQLLLWCHAAPPAHLGL